MSPRTLKHSVEPPPEMKEIIDPLRIISTKEVVSKDAVSEFVDAYLELKEECEKLKEGLAKYRNAKSKKFN